MVIRIMKEILGKLKQNRRWGSGHCSVSELSAL